MGDQSAEAALFERVLGVADEIGAESSLSTQACIPLATQGVDGDDGEQALMDLVQPIKPQQLQSCGKAHLNNSQFLKFVKSVFKGSPTNNSMGLARRIAVYSMVIQGLISKKFLQSQASEALVNFLITEADHLPIRAFPQLFEQILKVFLGKAEDEGSVAAKAISPLEFVPSFIHCIQNASKGQLDQDGAQEMELHDMNGNDYKKHVIKQICNSEWPVAQKLECAVILRELSHSFEADIAEIVFDKMLLETSRAPLEIVPKMALQLLLLTSTCAKLKAGKADIAVNHLISYFDAAAAATSPAQDLVKVEGSMITTFHIVASQHPELGRSFIKLCRLGRDGIHQLTYFRIALLLALSKIKRFEAQVHQCLFSRVEASINYASRCIKSKWLKEIRKKESENNNRNDETELDSEGFDSAIDKLMSRSMDGGWDLVIQALPGLGNAFVNYWNTYSASMVIGGDLSFEAVADESQKKLDISVDARVLASRYGRTILFKTFKSHVVNRRNVICQLCERTAGASASSATGGSLQAIRLLQQLSTSTPIILLEDANSLKEIIAYLPRMFPRVAHGTIQALHPLFKMRPDLVELLVLVLRKAAFQRDESCRVIAVNGLLYLCYHDLLRNFDSEFFGSLRRFLTYGKAIRSCLYKGLARIYKQNSPSRGMILELICTQADKAINPRETSVLAKYFFNCVDVSSRRATEPIDALVELAVDCHLSCSSPKLKELLESLQKDLCNCDPQSEVNTLAAHVNKDVQVSIILLELLIGTAEQVLRWCLKSDLEQEVHQLFDHISNFMDAHAALKCKTSNATKKRKAGVEESTIAESSAPLAHYPFSSLDFDTLKGLMTKIGSEHDDSGGRLHSYVVQNLTSRLCDARWKVESIAKDGKCNPSRRLSAQENVDRVQGIDDQSIHDMVELSCGAVLATENLATVATCQAALPLLLSEVYKLVDQSEDSTLLSSLISCVHECLRIAQYCGKLQEVIAQVTFESGGEPSLPNLLKLVQEKICDVLLTPANLKNKSQETAAALDVLKTICEIAESRELSLADSSTWMKEKCAVTATRNAKLSSKLTEVYIFMEYRVQAGGTDLVCVEKLCGAVQKTLGALETNDESQCDSVDGNDTQTFAFLMPITSSNVIKEIVGFLNECMTECEWVAGEIKRYPSSVSNTPTAEEKDEETDSVLARAATRRKIQESMLFARLEAIAMCLTILTNTNLPRAGQAKSRAAEDCVIKSLIKFYKLIGVQLKLAVSSKQKVFVSSLQRLINRVAKELTSNVYQLLPFIQSHEQEENRSNAANITKELRTIPELIYSIEDFEVHLLKLSKSNACTAELARFVKPSSNRDFKIQQKADTQRQKKRALQG